MTGDGYPACSALITSTPLAQTAELHVEPVTHDQARIARDAYRDFGKGGGHKADLNFGDCFAYALAKSTGDG